MMMFEVPVSPIDLRSFFLSILAMTMLSAGGGPQSRPAPTMCPSRGQPIICQK